MINSETGNLCGHTVSVRTRKIWAVQLELLQVFKEFCNAHGLCYYLWSGSLLGAVRHQGLSLGMMMWMWQCRGRIMKRSKGWLYQN